MENTNKCEKDCANKCENCANKHEKDCTGSTCTIKK